ncbi:MAG TPA: hypothetical protein VEM96_11270 [Pyrinomonadaceae bacterium]|nr:hypothetical protein [Pyrinomonadaceae bacterium]
MKEDYLWDRSGEPDPELQKLEEILGTLRYQPRALPIPADIQIGRRRSFFPAFGIAAAIALFAVLLGLWFHFRRPVIAPPLEASRNSQTEQKPIETGRQVAPRKGISQSASLKSQRNNRKPAARNLVATRKTPFIRRVTSQPELTPQELAEKEQVLIALRLVSAKLNLAQRKTQGAPQLNNIRNQRKIG